MGKLNQLKDPEVCKVIDEVCRKTLKAGLMLGTAGGPLEVCLKRGIQWVALGSDCGGIISQAATTLKHAQTLSNSIYV
jgi:2-keto-3-deoxy-L-rhamnonate aldolase RhmA